jgi:hypothetical protein
VLAAWHLRYAPDTNLAFAFSPSLFVYGGGEGPHDIFRVEMWQAFAVAALTVFIGFFLLRTAMRLQVRA